MGNLILSFGYRCLELRLDNHDNPIDRYLSFDIADLTILPPSNKVEMGVIARGLHTTYVSC